MADHQSLVERATVIGLTPIEIVEMRNSPLTPGQGGMVAPVIVYIVALGGIRFEVTQRFGWNFSVKLTDTLHHVGHSETAMRACELCIRYWSTDTSLFNLRTKQAPGLAGDAALIQSMQRVADGYLDELIGLGYEPRRPVNL